MFRHEESRGEVVGELLYTFVLSFPPIISIGRFLMLRRHLFPGEQMEHFVRQIVMPPAFWFRKVNQDRIEAWDLTGGTGDALRSFNIEHKRSKVAFNGALQCKSRLVSKLPFPPERFTCLGSILKGTALVQPEAWLKDSRLDTLDLTQPAICRNPSTGSF